VFDANSLGKWMYDWTVYLHGGESPLSEITGEMWLLLIKLAAKTKRAGEGAGCGLITAKDADLLEEFVEGGNRVLRTLNELLAECEGFMWQAANGGRGGSVRMGTDSGVEFVETMFGRDRQLENSERWMTSVRLWITRFDANCVDILQRVCRR